jgi:thiamine-phosphate pyrophosphorylase
MSAQIYLIAPKSIDMNSFPQTLSSLLDVAPAAAFLLTKGDRSDTDFAAIAGALLPITQEHNCALLLEDSPALAKSIGADGAHITTGLTDVKSAIKDLSPAMIVGASTGKTNHEAMSIGEAGVDYILFGNLSAPATDQDRDLAEWWAETFEVPAVFSNPAATQEELSTHNCEFIALGDTIWDAKEGAADTYKNARNKLADLA